MTENKINYFTLDEAPENYEVIQRQNGAAAVRIAGRWSVDASDDTELVQHFAYGCAYARMVSEADGRAVTDLCPILTDEDGEHFSCEIGDVPTGGPYHLDIVGMSPEEGYYYHVRGQKRHHLYVGDLYLIFGQSNAAGMGKSPVSDEPMPGVHVLRDMKTWDIASFPFVDDDYCKENMFLTFAKRVYRQSGVPIGLLPAAMGGAPLSRFLPEERGDLYRKMKDRLAGKVKKIRAVLWYQGCTDAGDNTVEGYAARFSSLVKALRADFADPTLPVFTFQLNRYIAPAPSDSLQYRYAKIRDEQRIAAQTVPGVHILPTTDGVHMSDVIHGSSNTNRLFGERLASQVLARLYGIGREVPVPVLARAEWEADGKIRLCFSGVVSYLYPLCRKTELPVRVRVGEKILAPRDFTVRAGVITVDVGLCAPASEPTYVDICYGTDPGHYVIDFMTEMPLLASLGTEVSH